MVSPGSSAKYILGGAAAICFGAALWFYTMGNPIDDLALVRHAQTTRGEMIDIVEDPASGDYGDDRTTTMAIYSFRTVDGQEITAHTPDYPGHARDGLPRSIDVEYLTSNPRVNRIKGNGSQSIGQWIVRTSLSLALLCLFVSPGSVAVVEGVRQAKIHIRNRRHEAFTEWAAEVKEVNESTPRDDLSWLYQDGLALQKRFRREGNEKLDRMLHLLNRAIEVKTRESPTSRESVIR